MRPLIILCSLLMSLPAFAAELAETATPLGTLPERVKPADVAVSPDGQRYGYVRRRDWRVSAVVDGVEHPAFDWIVNQTIAFSPDNRHVVYEARAGRRTQMVLDGLAQAFYDSIGNWMVSATGGRIAAAVQRENTAFAVLDGSEGRHWQQVRLSALSRDGNVMAYVAGNDGQERVIVGNSQGKKYEKVYDICLTPDGRHHAYRAQGERKWRIVVDGGVDGVEHKSYDHVSGPRLSEDGQHVAYTAVRGGQFLFVYDEKESSLFDESELKAPALSPDGQHYAAVARRGPRAHVVVDGQEKNTGDEVSPLPAFSADSRRLAYGIRKSGGACQLIIDDKPAGSYEAVHAVVFSPDSKRFAAVISQGGRMAVAVDGKAGQTYDEVQASSLSFSADSARMAYAARRAGKWHVVVDGVESQPHDALIFAAPLAFDAKNTLHLFAANHRQVEQDLGRKATEHDLIRLEIAPK